MLAAFKVYWTAISWSAKDFRLATTPTELETLLMAEKVLTMSPFERTRYTQQCALEGVAIDETAMLQLYTALRAKFE